MDFLVRCFLAPKSLQMLSACQLSCGEFLSLPEVFRSLTLHPTPLISYFLNVQGESSH